MGQITSLIIGLIVVALFFTSFVAMTSYVEDSYQYNVSENYSGLYGNLSTTLITQEIGETDTEGGLLNSTKGSIETWDTGDTSVLSWYSWADWIFKSFKQTFVLIANIGPLANIMVNSAGGELGIPAYALAAIGIIILIIFLFYIFGALLGREF